ncbi:MAG: hypothetical protein GY850_43665 [bacterium]|nr:hypothetical protein [bacterium]
MMKCGFALGLHSYFSDEGALSVFSKLLMIESLTSIFDIYPPLEDSLFQSFFFDLTGRLLGWRQR